MKKSLLTFIALMFFAFISFDLRAQDTWDGVDEGGVVVVPKAIAEYCQSDQGTSTRPLTQEDVDAYVDIVACLKDILRLRNDPSAEVLLEAQKLSELFARQTIYTSIAEGMGQKVYSFEYPDKVLGEMSETLSESTNNKEILASIMFLEKESAYLQNKILQMKATEMQLNETIEFANSGGR